MMNKSCQFEIFYATGNRNKHEIAQNFLKSAIPELKLHYYNIDIPERQEENQAVISQEKALYAWKKIQKPVLVDDAGIYLDAYPQFPGFMTKFAYYGLGVKGFHQLIGSQTGATMQINLTYCNGPEHMHTVTGSIHGTLTQPLTPIPSTTGNPFDYFFIPDGKTVPYYNLSSEEKTPETSFRLNGLYKMGQWLSQNPQ